MNEKQIHKNIRFLVIVFTIIAVLVLLIAKVMTLSLDRMYQTVIMNQLEENTSKFQSLLINTVNAERQTLHAISAFITFDKDSDIDILSDVINNSKTDTSFLRIGYIDENGDGYSVSSGFSTPYYRPITDLSIESQSAISEAWSGADIISSPYYDTIIGKTVISYAVPIVKNDEMQAVLYAVQDTSLLSSIIQNFRSVSEDGFAALISESGYVIASTVSYTSESFSTINDLDLLSDDAKEQLVDLLSPHTASSTQIQSDGQTYYGCVKPSEINDYFILLLDTDQGISGQLFFNMNITQLMGISICVIAVIFILISYRIIVKNSSGLIQLAYNDPLTGAYNSEKFLQLLRQNINNNIERSVVAINVRQFKFINEIFGVTQSDKLLCFIASEIKNRLTDDEFFCRDTADMFFICTTITDYNDIYLRLDALFEKITGYADLLHAGYSISFYCGVASSHDCVQTENIDSELMTHVMFALNLAKKSQKTNIKFYNNEIYDKEKIYNYIQSHMQQALENSEFKMYLQPKFNLKHGVLDGAEALVRWITDGKQTIFPDQFIPLFEKNGFCINLDLYMFEQACKQLRLWLDEGLSIVPISVNQTKLLFYEDGYAKKLENIAKKYNIPPKYLTLEILEGLAFDDLNKLNDCITQLKSIGFRISMDDFGSGYSSLNTLGKISIDELKLDRAFLMAVAKDHIGNQLSILELIISMAKTLNISTVAEGVETIENEEMLKKLGCDQGQGYYYSRPIPTDEFSTKFLIPFSKHKNL